jgi:hypothetical protein
MYEQVWRDLDDQGIGKVLTAVVVKISAHSQMWPLRIHANQVAPPVMFPCQAPAQVERAHREALSADDWKVVVDQPCAVSSHEQLGIDAKAPASAIG